MFVLNKTRETIDDSMYILGEYKNVRLELSRSSLIFKSYRRSEKISTPPTISIYNF